MKMSLYSHVVSLAAEYPVRTVVFKWIMFLVRCKADIKRIPNRNVMDYCSGVLSLCYSFQGMDLVAGGSVVLCALPYSDAFGNIFCCLFCQWSSTCFILNRQICFMLIEVILVKPHFKCVVDFMAKKTTKVSRHLWCLVTTFIHKSS